MRRLLTATLVAAAAASVMGGPAKSETSVQLEEVASGLTYPLAMVVPPDGTKRKFVIEQIGVIKVIDERGRMLDEPFLNIQAKLVHLEPFFDGEGLLGIAFHPKFKENGKFT